MPLLNIILEIVSSNLFDIDNVKLSTFLNTVFDLLNDREGERNDMVEKLLYSNWFDIEPKFVTKWISSTLDANTLRDHDAIIRRVAQHITSTSSTSTNYYVDVNRSLIDRGIKYDELRLNAFLMERELVTQIKYIWSRSSSDVFKGRIVLEENHNRVSLSYIV